MKKRTTRLHFSEKDLENAAVSRAAKKAERAADRADAAKARLPTKGKLRTRKKRQPSMENSFVLERRIFQMWGKRLPHRAGQ